MAKLSYFALRTDTSRQDPDQTASHQTDQSRPPIMHGKTRAPPPSLDELQREAEKAARAGKKLEPDAGSSTGARLALASPAGVTDRDNMQKGCF